MVNQISAEELADRLDAGPSFVLVDTRPKDSYEAWHVPGAENVPFDPREGLSDDQVARVRELTDGDSIVAICGKGLTSTSFAFALDAEGIEDVTVVKGGMEDWSRVYDIVPITGDDDLTVLQIQRRAKGCLGYVVGSESSGEAAVVDATRQTDVFKVAAETAGLTIKHVLDTHVHADHISGGPRLAEELGVPYYLGSEAADRGVEYDFRPLANWETFSVGDVDIEAIHAPGHTSEMTNYLVDGTYLLTSDTLFVDSVGRTELQFGESDASKGAELLYDSLHDVVFGLPGDTVALPGHVTVRNDGRWEGGSPGEPVSARLSHLSDRLELLALDREAFVRRLAENAPEKPPNYETVIGINLGTEPVPNEHEATGLELGPNNCAA